MMNVWVTEQYTNQTYPKFKIDKKKIGIMFAMNTSHIYRILAEISYKNLGVINNPNTEYLHIIFWYIELFFNIIKKGMFTADPINPNIKSISPMATSVVGLIVDIPWNNSMDKS